jgi:hypothetical protein
MCIFIIFFCFRKFLNGLLCACDNGSLSLLLNVFLFVEGSLNEDVKLQSFSGMKQAKARLVLWDFSAFEKQRAPLRTAR